MNAANIKCLAETGFHRLEVRAEKLAQEIAAGASPKKIAAGIAQLTLMAGMLRLQFQEGSPLGQQAA